MAPASASPPPCDRSEIGQRGRRDADKQDRQDEKEQDKRKHSEGKHETYGPLDIKRDVKDDGRALILYTRREREDK
jgi:hypothetical protein